MMKWLRKHTKKIMVGVVLFAMFSFVGGPVITEMFNPDPGSIEIGTAFGEKLTRAKVFSIAGDSDILQSFLGRGWFAATIHPEMGPRHWYMLTREAAESGIVVPEHQVETYLTNRGITPDLLKQFENQRLYSYPVVRTAFSRFLAVQVLARRVMSAATPSQAEIRHYVRDTQEKVRVSLVALDAENFVDPDEELSEEAIQAHFEAYKDLDPAESESGFGYRFPRRVAVQYFGASVEDIEPQVACSQDEAVAHWRKNRANYTKTQIITTTTLPATGPSQRETRQVEMKFSEARMPVERDVRREKAQRLIKKAMREACADLLEPWQGQAVDPDTGYKKEIPESVRAPDFMRRVCDRISADLGVPLTFKETGLLSQDELANVQAIGKASLQVSANERIGFSEYAFRVPLFFQKGRGSETTLSLQRFQTPDSPLTQTTFKLIDRKFQLVPAATYLFRVVDARVKQSPDSIDEVREKVILDLRTARAFERMEADAKALLATSRHLGLDDALDLMEDLRVKSKVERVFGPHPLTRRIARSLAVPAISVVGTASQKLVDACFEMAADGWTPEPMELPDTPDVARATTRPAMDPTPVVRLVPLPKLHRWIIVEFNGLDPVRQDQFESQYRDEAYTFFTNPQGRRMIEIRMSWFEPENIEERCGFVPAESTDDEESSEG
ncbi:MAG: hypothetical protein O7F76_00440 [Planctomycetota bacterium]|nr:hypothetical protein [Planctomycetota bacterium]